MGDLDFFGFLKIDVLGLKTLDTIKYTMDLANLNYDWYDSEDYSDPEVYNMLRNGETADVFQMSKYSPTKMIADFNVHDIEGLCAVNAGNRPGPLEKDKTTGKSMVDLYIEHVKTNMPEDWGNNDVNKILKNTYGCLWYQENCIMLGRVMAGYSMGGADSRIRKVLGKKKVKMIPEIRNEFIYGKKSLFDNDHNVIGISEEPSDYCEGAINRGYSLELCEKIFDTMAAFAKYSFNKSHSFCYGVLAYKTAWLSFHYPIEFAIANCTINDKEEEIISTLASARKRKIRILPPDINKSDVNFSNDNGAIRYGLKAIKGIGERVVDFLKDYKMLDNVPFKDFNDFYTRMHDGNNQIVASLIANIQRQTGKASPNPLKKDVEIALILSGCFDFQDKNRFRLVNNYISNIRRENPATIKIVGEDKKFPLDENKYDSKQKLALEKFYMGAYISEHPLDKFPYIDLDSAQEGEKVRIGGIVTGIIVKKTRIGNDYLVIKFKTKDDIERSANIFDLDKVISLQNDLKKNQIIVVTGTFSQRYHNINAIDVKIQIDKKQVLQQESLQVQHAQETKTIQNIPVSTMMFADVFNDVFNM
jgi:DNA polymerase-3 subunit alpha